MNSKERHEARYQRRKLRREEKMRLRNEGHTFRKVTSFGALRRAFYQCRKGTNWKPSTQGYGANVLRNSYNISRKLRRHGTVSRGFIEFYIHERGKRRHIHSVHIFERVAQKAVCDFGIVEVMERSLIAENGACRKGMGTGYSAKCLLDDLRQWYRKHGNAGYIVMGDCHNFFPSIPHEVVEAVMRKAIADEDLVDLTMGFINEAPEGLTLGSQVCQINAVAAPDMIDHYVKEVMRVKHYCRHMDDWYALVETREEADEILTTVTKLYASIGIQMNPKKTHKIKLSHGFVWLQDRYYLTDTGRVIRRAPRTRIRANERKLVKLAGMAARGEIPPEAVQSFYGSICGYIEEKNENAARRRWASLYAGLAINQGGESNDPAA